MEQVSSKVYEQVRIQVLRELEVQKQKNRRINLAADAVFAQARRKYLDKVADKYGRGGHGNPTWESVDKFLSATKLALELIGQKNARTAYLNGYAEEANKKAEQILEAMIAPENS